MDFIFYCIAGLIGYGFHGVLTSYGISDNARLAVMGIFSVILLIIFLVVI